MLSEQKTLIRIAELWSIAGASVCLGLAITGIFFPSMVYWKNPLPWSLFLSVGIPYALSVFIIKEFLELVDPDRVVVGNGKIAVFPSKSESQAMLQWASPIARMLSRRVSGILIAIGAVAATATGYLTLREPIRTQHLDISFLLAVSGLFMQSIATLASTSRMPGSFTDHFEPGANLDGDSGGS